MGWSTQLALAPLLERERPLLDEIFGEGAYQVEGSHPHEVIVRSDKLEWRPGYDARDGSIGSVLVLSGFPWEEQAIPDVWARYLEEEIPQFPRNSSGHVTLAPEEQIRRELKWLARLVSEIFSDPQNTRDAAHFVRGYQRAYNDWASGTGPWDVED